MHSTLAALWKCESGGRNRYPGPTNAATISAQKLSQKKKYSDTGSRTRVCSVKANRASRYTISDNC